MGKYASKDTTPGSMIWPGSAGIVTYAGGATWGPPLESIAVIAYPPSGIPYSSGSSWGTSYTTTGSGTVLTLAASPTFTGKVIMSGDSDIGNVTDGVNLLLTGKNTISYSYNLNTKLGDYLSIVSNKAGAIPFKLDSDGGITSGKIDLSGAFGSTVKALTLRNTTTAANGNEITQNFYFKSSAWTDNLQAQLALITDGYSSSKLVYRSHDLAEGAADTLIDRWQVLKNGNWGINGGLHVGGFSDPGDNNLWVDGTAQEPNFTSGWQGSNWKIEADGDAEFNNVLIRGGLSVYELIINQLHYQNGGLIIGAGAGKVATIETATVGSEVLTFHDPEGNDMVPFTAGAIVMVQRVDISKTVANGYTGDVVKKIVRQVASVSGMEVTLTSTTGWTPGDPAGDDIGIIEVGDEICAIGHVSNTSLDSALYLSATDSDNPFLRVMDGVSSYSKWSLGDKTTVKLQIGNLASLASYDIIPASPGYGLYCDNAYLNGRIVLPNAGMTNEGSSDSDIRIYAGSAYDDMATAPFRVTQNGSLTATGIAELGTATATVDGKASNVAIRGCDIWENAYNGDNSSLLINRIGYNGGTTKYRDFAVYNGKGSKLITVGGGTMNYVSFGNINYDDLEISLYGTCQNVWAKQLIYAYGGVSDNVLISWNTPASTTNTSYTKLKTFTLGAYLKPNRTLRLKFDLKATSNTSYATIYRNGSPVGTERITSSDSYVTYSEDISGWNPSDAIELYVKSSDAGNTASVQNFRICGDMVTSIATELQATAS